MTTQITANEEFSNIVTPPDFVHNASQSIVLIDASASEIEDLAFYLKTSKNSYNVYVYATGMKDKEWLKKAMHQSIDVIVNTIHNDHSVFKDKLAVKINAYHYGSKRFLTAMDKHINKPLDYFIQLDMNS